MGRAQQGNALTLLGLIRIRSAISLPRLACRIRQVIIENCCNCDLSTVPCFGEGGLTIAAHGVPREFGGPELLVRAKSGLVLTVPAVAVTV